MELYSEYIKERENADIVYNDIAFMTYKKDGEGVFIIDAYVKPEHRKTGVARELLTQIENITDTKVLYTSTDITANNWIESEKAIINLGFEFKIKRGNQNYYIKEIE